MQEQLISFNTAKLAKEKSFDAQCWQYYDNGGVLIHSITKISNKMSLTSVPTQSLLQKWLREIHNIDCFPQQVFLSESTKIKYTPLITTDINDINSENYCNYSFEKIYDIYEQAFEFGLQEALKLIK